MSNRGLAIISIVSGLIAVSVFIMVISAYAGAGGGVTAGAPVVAASPGQPVDSEFLDGAGGSGGNQSAGPAVTPQPVSTDASQAQAPQQPVVAPSANAPANPFTAGIH